MSAADERGGGYQEHLKVGCAGVFCRCITLAMHSNAAAACVPRRA